MLHQLFGDLSFSRNIISRGGAGRSGFIRLYALSVFSQKRILNRQQNLKCPLKVNKSPWVAGTIFLFNNFSFVLSKNFKLFPGYYHPHELLTLDTTTDITTSSTSLIPRFSSDTNNTMVYIYKGGTANIDCEVDNLGKRHINHHILLSHALACEENFEVTCLQSFYKLFYLELREIVWLLFDNYLKSCSISELCSRRGVKCCCQLI